LYTIDEPNSTSLLGTKNTDVNKDLTVNAKIKTKDLQNRT